MRRTPIPSPSPSTRRPGRAGPATAAAAAGLTPLQRSMRDARRHRCVSSPRLWLVAASSACLLGTLLYWCVRVQDVASVLFKPPAGSGSSAAPYAASSSAYIFWNEHSPTNEEGGGGGGGGSSLSWSIQSLRNSFVADRQGGVGEGIKKTSKKGERSRRFRGGESALKDSDGDSGGGNGAPAGSTPLLSSSSSSTAAADSRPTIDPLQLQNPSFYGWVPETYPNPLLDPIRCSIAYLHTSATLNSAGGSEAGVDDEPQPTGEEGASSQSSSSDEDGAVANSTRTQESPAQTPPLRLCDPDWAAGQEYLQEIANALTNFSYVFGQPDWQNRLREHLYVNHVRHHGVAVVDESLLQNLPPTVEMGVAMVRKMNLPAVLRQGSFYAYEDEGTHHAVLSFAYSGTHVIRPDFGRTHIAPLVYEDDMVNDAAQIFARSLHDAWWSTARAAAFANSLQEQQQPTDAVATQPPMPPPPSHHNGILIFLSIQDRVCFISTGSELATILPWWRLDHVVASMKPDLSHREYGTAVLRAIQTICDMLQAGPPTLSDRLGDFVSRFGVVICFAVFTFCFGAWGEYRDRRKRWQYAEQRSRLTGIDRDKARHLQREYRTRSCPICLESFDYGDGAAESSASAASTPKRGALDSTFVNRSTEEEVGLLRSDSVLYLGSKLKRVDSFGIPCRGADGKPLKLLRCGHVFCERYVLRSGM